MGIGERVWRYVIMFAGVCVISLGVALITKSNLGASAISVIPYTLELEFPQVSYGMYVGVFNGLLVLMQLIVLRSRANLVDLVQQAVLCAFFGSFVDADMFLLTWLDPSLYLARFATLLTGVVALAFGGYLTLISHVGVMAGDGFTRMLSRVSGKDFGICRVISDSSMAIVAVVLNVAFFGALVSVREGTVVTALITGLVLGFFNRHLTRFEHFLLPKNQLDEESAKPEATVVPAESFVVTIAREYASGGREVGRRVARELGVPFYDSEIVSRMARAGYQRADVEDNEQKVGSSALAQFYRAYGTGTGDADLPRVDRMFAAESRIVRELAAEGSCVIVGRLANWILRDHAAKLTVFVSAPEAAEAQRASERDGLSLAEAEQKVREVNRQRAEHCRYCTGTTWDDTANYDLVVDTGETGVEGAAALVAERAREAMRESANAA